MEKRQKNLALIGFGYWGRNIFRNLYEMDALHTACDTNLSLLENYKNKFPDIDYTNSVESVMNDSTIKAVLIASPASTHYALAKQALIAGKDVFVEKPLALAVKEGEELVDLAKKTNHVVMVGHILQYHPAVIKLKEMITLGELGKICYVYSNRLNIGKLRTEENILWSFAPHDISVALMLLDEEPLNVSAFGEDYVSRGVYDTTLTMLEFKNGIKAHIFVSWLHPYKEQKLIVVGSKAMAVFDDLSEEKLFLHPHKIEWKDGKIPVAQKADFKVVPVSEGEPLRLELEHFIDCVKTRKTPKTDCFEGLKVLRILAAAENWLLKKKSEEVKPVGLKEKYFVHETACIDEGVSIGEGTKIWNFSHILKNSKIGRDCIIGQNVAIGSEVVIGNRCKIQNNVSIYQGITLEDEVFCGPSCVFTNVINPRSAISRMKEVRSTLVRQGATIGANATIVCGHTMGRYTFIGAGAVVTKDVPDYALVYGNPAKQAGWMCECGVKLEFKRKKARCQECNKEYLKEGLKVVKLK